MPVMHRCGGGGVQGVEANGVSFWGCRGAIMLSFLSRLVRFVRKMITNMVVHRLEFKIASKIYYSLCLCCHVQLISCIFIFAVCDRCWSS